jgi:replication-associated recombination protein RarA
MNLAEKLRPANLDEIIGQEHVKKAVRSWIERDSFPRNILLTGPVGTGKSCFAEIISRACQGPEGWKGADIREINAGTVGKVDDARLLAEDSRSRPFTGQGRYRVFCLEEAHRMTDAAQDALLVPMEKNEYCVWILTSSEPKDLLPAIRSRCSAATFDLKPLNESQMISLAEKALVEFNPKGDWNSDEAAKWLYERDVRQPREILGVLDLWFSGVPLEEASQKAATEPLYRDICGAVLRGDWTKTSNLLSQVKTADSRGLASILSAFLRSEILKNTIGPKADAIAACLVGLDQTGFADGTAYGGTVGLLYKVCKTLGAK